MRWLNLPAKRHTYTLFITQSHLSHHIVYTAQSGAEDTPQFLFYKPSSQIDSTFSYSVDVCGCVCTRVSVFLCVLR